MFKRISATQERALAERLRRDAMASWPDFSEPLHQRIVSAVQRRRASDAAAAKAASSALRRPARLWAVFVAVCLLGAVMLVGRQLALRENAQGTGDILAHADSHHADARPNVISPPIDSPVAPSPPDPTIAGLLPAGVLADHNVDNLDGLIVSAAVSPQTADLEHDIRLAAETLLERLPVNVELVAGP